MRIDGQRTDGLLKLHVGAGVVVLLATDGRKSKPLTDREADAFGPFTEGDNSLAGRQQTERNLARAAVASLETFALARDETAAHAAAWDTRGRAIQDPNSSGQGFHAGHSSHPLHGTIMSHGYAYSHSTPIHSSRGVEILHTYKKGEHNVSITHGQATPWQTSVSSGSGHHWRSGSQDAGAEGLDKHLGNKDKRYSMRDEAAAHAAAWDTRGRASGPSTYWRSTGVAPQGNHVGPPLQYEPKDQMRVSGIKARARGDRTQEARLAANMANAITDPAKALRRAHAATAAGQHHIAAPFYVRHGQLSADMRLDDAFADAVLLADANPDLADEFRSWGA